MQRIESTRTLFKPIHAPHGSGRPPRQPRDKKRKFHKKNNKNRKRKSVFGDPNGKPPFYDPKEQHIHCWTYGTIASSEKGTSQFFNFRPKKFTGKYCKICHLGVPKFHINLWNNKEFVSDIQDSLNKFTSFIHDYKINSVPNEELVNKRWKRVLGKVMHRWVWGIRYPGDPVCRDLILPGVYCTFYWGEKTKKGIIISQLENDNALIEEVGTGMGYEVNPRIVISIHGKYNIKPQLYAIGEIPQTVMPEKVVVWKQKWNNFMKWTDMVSRLKFILPGECEYYQTFYDDEIFEPPIYGPPDHHSYQMAQIRHSRWVIQDYEQKEKRRKIWEAERNEHMRNMVDNCIFLRKTNGDSEVHTNYVFVDKTKFTNLIEVEGGVIIERLKELTIK